MAPRPQPLAIAASDPAIATCTFGYIQGQLGQNTLSQRRMVKYLQALVDHHHFPAPLPAIIKGGAITRAVHPSSKWVRTAVHAWLDGFIPPDCATTIDAQSLAAAATDMDAAAQNLRLVGGRDHAGRKSA